MNFSNIGLSTLLTGIGPSATAFSFPVGEGARFASNMRIIIWNKSLFADPLSALVAGKGEIAHITTLSGDNATVVARGQEETTALDFSDNTQEYGVCNAITAGILASFLTTAPNVAAPIMGMCTAPTGNATTYYFPSGVNSSTSEIDVEAPITRAGTIKNLIVRIYRATANNSDKYTVTIRKNGADTALTKQTGVANAGDNIVSDLTDSVTFAQLDKMSIKVVGDGSGSGVADILTWSYDFIPT